MLLEAHNLTQKYHNKVVVKNVNLNIDKGQLVSLLGHNGAGKSTTVNMIAGLKQPSQGEIILNGINSKNPKYRSQIGIVFQNSILDNELSIRQNLLSRAKMYHHIDKTYFKQLINLFNLKPIIKQKYQTLSGGQKRRVDIVRALINQPNLLILDEPTTGLDLQTRNVIWQALNQCRKQYGMAILLITHYLEESNSADIINIMDKGKIIAQNSAKKLCKLYAPNILTLFTNQTKSISKMIDPQLIMNTNPHQMKLKLDTFQQAIQLLNRFNQQIDNFSYHNGDMNDVFITLTGKEIK